MTVPNGTDTRKEEVGNGVKVAFDFDFEIFAHTDLAVYTYVTATGVQTPKTLTTHYTVAINGVDNALTTIGGTVTYVTAPLGTETSLILGDYDFDQTKELETAGNLPENVLENGYDKLTYLCLQNKEKLERALTQQESYTGTAPTFPTPVTDRGIKYDATGKFIVTDNDPDEQVANATTQANNAATSASNASTSATNAGTSETNAAASAAAALVSASKGPKTHNVVWNRTSNTEIVVDSGSAFKGVATDTWFELDANKTFDITTSGVAGGLDTGSQATSTFYFLLGIGDTSGTNSPHVLAVTETNYATFVVGDLPSGYDDYKRIGTFRTNSTGSGEVESGSFFDGLMEYNRSVENESNTTSSASFVGFDFSDVVPSIIRDIKCVVYNHTASNSDFQPNGLAGGFTLFQTGAGASNAMTRLRLDSSGIIEARTSAGSLTATVHGFWDNLDIEGQ